MKVQKQTGSAIYASLFVILGVVMVPFYGFWPLVLLAVYASLFYGLAFLYRARSKKVGQ